MGVPQIVVFQEDNLKILKSLPSESVDLIYIDPPFNTGRPQIRKRFHTDREGNKVSEESYGYEDSFSNFIDGFLAPRMEEAKRILRSDGSLFFHIDYREVHYCKVMLDSIFGRESFNASSKPDKSASSFNLRDKYILKSSDVSKTGL